MKTLLIIVAFMISFSYCNAQIQNHQDSTIITAIVITGIESFEDQIYIFPNPVKSSFDIITVERITEVLVIGNQGQIILKSDQKQIDLSEFLPAVYIVRLTTSSGVFCRKIVKL